MKVYYLNNKNKKEKYKVVSLFSGAGGLDMGFEEQGFKTIWAIDIDSDACETHRQWSKTEVIQGDISEIDLKQVPNADVIIGGFPCQGFSLAGPRKIDDKRNILYRYFVKLVERNQPYAFVAENVKGILTLGEGAVIEAIIEDFSEKGYLVFPHLVNAADYGVPQDRWRVFMLGFRKDLKIFEFKFPEPFKKRLTLGDVLKDMPKAQSIDICSESYSPRYMSRNRKRGWNEVSYTIPAMAKQVTLHPSSPDMKKISEDKWVFGGDGTTRRFSWQEVAAIQTFPKDMHFYGNLGSKYKQIGNAVPVKLACILAKELKVILDSFLSNKNIGEKVGL